MEHVHLIGIGGSGLSAIARVLLESGYTVSGSDRQSSPFTQNLQEAGVQVFLGHRPENVAGADLVLRSSAIPDENVEVQAARAAGVPVLKRADFLGQWMAGKLGVAVAGTHGKTTTTAMIAWMLSALGQDPTYMIGGISRNLGTNAHAGQGSGFVIEADEYDHMFLGLRPKIAVVTSVEHDHPDCYPTPQAYYQAFLDFAGCLAPEGVLLACENEPGAARLLRAVRDRGQFALGYFVTRTTEGEFASDPQPAFQAHHLQSNPSGGFTFDVTCSLEGQTAQVNLQVPGEHNVQNALAALSVACWLHLPLEQAALALSNYQGTGRRFEVLGEVAGITVIDDYAHHPTEIRATLSAARARYPGRALWAVWQPHTYSRTRALFNDFVSAFKEADHVLVTEVYAAREPVSSDFSARKVVKAMDHPDAHFVPDIVRATLFLLARLHPGDVLLVLSAGDADQISAQVLTALQERSQIHV